jgi:hypothetical protein
VEENRGIEERDTLIEKFSRGWTSCYFSPKFVWRIHSIGISKDLT